MEVVWVILSYASQSLTLSFDEWSELGQILLRIIRENILFILGHQCIIIHLGNKISLF